MTAMSPREYIDWFLKEHNIAHVEIHATRKNEYQPSTAFGRGDPGSFTLTITGEPKKR